MALTIDVNQVPVESLGSGRTKRVLVDAKHGNSKDLIAWLISMEPGSQGKTNLHRGAANFLFILGGGGTVEIEGNKFRLEPGQLIWLAEGEKHRFTNDSNLTLRFLEFFTPQLFETENLDGDTGPANPNMKSKVLHAHDVPVQDVSAEGKQRVWLVTKDLVGDERAQAQIVRYAPGTVTKNHYHTNSENFFYMLYGKGEMFVNGTGYELVPGKAFFFERNDPHRIVNTSDLEEFGFLELHVPPYYDQVYLEK